VIAKEITFRLALVQVGQAALPEGINRADALPLKGPHVLQVMACQDVAQLSRRASIDTCKQRQEAPNLLVLALRFQEGRCSLA
jgi:hypothetical protein